jgi:hypothetical protein
MGEKLTLPTTIKRVLDQLPNDDRWHRAICRYHHHQQRRYRRRCCRCCCCRCRCCRSHRRRRETIPRATTNTKRVQHTIVNDAIRHKTKNNTTTQHHKHRKTNLTSGQRSTQQKHCELRVVIGVELHRLQQLR